VQLRLRRRLRALRTQSALVLRHPSNRGSRRQRAWSILRYEINSMRGVPTEVTFADGMRLAASKGGNSSSRAVFARLPDWPEMQIWQRWLEPGDVFVDVGANVGLYSLVAAGVGAEVIAVEPAPDMADLLRANVGLNPGAQVTVHQCAVMDRAGTVDLEGPDPNRRVASHTASGANIPATTLDELLGSRRVRGIKIDVEGNERLVLDGARRTLHDGGVELIQLEWNDTSLSALGEGRGPVAERLHRAGLVLLRCASDGSVEVFASGEVPEFGADVFAARPDVAEWISKRRWEVPQ
jgi:FkbM family methyltransferase